MTRSELLTAIKSAEKASDSAARSLGVLRRMVELVLAINGDEPAATGATDLTRHVNDLAQAPKPLLKAWAATCCHDPLLDHLINSRRKYARADRLRGKGSRDLEVVVNITYNAATAGGFRGSRNQWEVLLRMRA